MVLQDELDHTKANAHLMLLDQNAEISQTIKTLETLSRLVNQLDADVEERLEHWSEVRLLPIKLAFTVMKYMHRISSKYGTGFHPNVKTQNH